MYDPSCLDFPSSHCDAHVMELPVGTKDLLQHRAVVELVLDSRNHQSRELVVRLAPDLPKKRAELEF